jgi:hypothetical protein
VVSSRLNVHKDLKPTNQNVRTEKIGLLSSLESIPSDFYLGGNRSRLFSLSATHLDCSDSVHILVKCIRVPSAISGCVAMPKDFDTPSLPTTNSAGAASLKTRPGASVESMYAMK